MSKPALFVAVVLGWFPFACLPILPAVQGQDAKAPEWKHGLEFRVRKAGEADFTKDTKKYGAEVYLDPNANRAVYVTETAGLGIVVPNFTAGADVKPPSWLYGLELKVRKAGEADFAKAVKFGIEVFKDENTGNLVYVSQTGDLAVIRGAGFTTVAETKPPKWLHGLALKVRKGGEVDFTDNIRRVGIEVLKDENAGNLVYISETGAIAVVPAASAAGGQKAPTWLYGLDFRVRKAGEADFTPKTANFGAEIFKDENTGFLVYVTDTGSIAVVPAGSAAAGETKAAKWMTGLELPVRKAGETAFAKDTKKYGAEIFTDVNTNIVVYISETGAIAISGGK